MKKDDDRDNDRDEDIAGSDADGQTKGRAVRIHSHSHPCLDPRPDPRRSILVPILVPIVVYADDIVILVRSQKAGERVLSSISRFITQKLKLKVNEAKSCVARPWEVKFLDSKHIC